MQIRVALIPLITSSWVYSSPNYIATHNSITALQHNTVSCENTLINLSQTILQHCKTVNLINTQCFHFRYPPKPAAAKTLTQAGHVAHTFWVLNYATQGG